MSLDEGHRYAVAMVGCASYDDVDLDVCSVLLMEFVGRGEEFVGNTVAIPPLKVPSGFEVQKVTSDFVAYVAGVGRWVSYVDEFDRTLPAVKTRDGGIESPQCVPRSRRTRQHRDSG